MRCAMQAAHLRMLSHAVSCVCMRRHAVTQASSCHYDGTMHMSPSSCNMHPQVVASYRLQVTSHNAAYRRSRARCMPLESYMLQVTPPYLHACTHICALHAYLHACMHICMLVCTPACLYACLRIVCISACLYAYLPRYVADQATSQWSESIASGCSVPSVPRVGSKRARGLVAGLKLFD